MSLTPLLFYRSLKSPKNTVRKAARRKSRRRLGLQTLEDRRLLAAQVVSAVPSSDSVAFEESFTVDLQYSVSAPLPNSPLLFGLHVHYDSSEIEFVTQSNVLSDGLVAVEDRVETVSDADPNTDRVWTISFVDVVNGFPLPSTPLPALLATLEFKALRRAGPTPLNFTASTSAGYDFEGSSIVVTIERPTFTVTRASDSPVAGQLTFRQAVELANAEDEPAVIEFAPGLRNVSLSGPGVTLTNDVSIVGPRADQLTIDGGNNDRLMVVQSGQSVAISGITLTGGNANGFGGAIDNAGFLSLDGVRITDSTTNIAGGAVNNSGTLLISDSEFSGNRAEGNGGAIANTGSVTIVNTTISDNSSNAFGGGVQSSGTATLRNSTVVLNRSDTNGAGLARFSGSFNVRNTIVAGNVVAGVVDDVFGTLNTTNSVIGGVINQIVDTSLAFNGASTRSHLLVGGSPAINQGDDADAIGLDGLPLLSDQRGRARIFGASVDAGAVEFVPAPGFVVTTPQGTTINEGSSVDLSVVLTAPPASSVVIGISSNSASQASPRFDRLVFGPGNWDSPQIVQIDAPEERRIDGDVASTITVSVIDEDSDDFYDEVGSQSFTFTTIDNDGRGILVSPVSGNTSEDETSATFTVVLDKAPTSTVTVPISSSDDGEGTVSVNSLTFTTANFDEPRTVTVTGADDEVVDGATAYSVVIGAAVSNDPLYSGFDPEDVMLINADNDIAGITVTPTVDLTTTEDGGTATFSVVLDTLPSSDVRIAVLSDNLDEGTVSTSLLTFTPTNGKTPQTVTITGVDDGAIADGHIDYSIVTEAASSGDPNYNGLDPSDVSVTNADNDTAGFVVNPAVDLMTSESGDSDSFTVALTTLPTADVTITLTSDDLDEGTVSPTTLTFSSSNGTTPQTVTVTGVDDQFFDGVKDYSIVLGTATSDDSNYRGLDPIDVRASNRDDDVPGITVTPTTGLTTTEAGGTATFTVALDTFPAGVVTINLQSSDLSEGTVSPRTLTFNGSNGTTPQPVTITGVDDQDIDDEVAYMIFVQPAQSADLNYNGLDGADVSVANSDNDDPELLDFGDLPDPTFPTLLANDGPRHAMGSLILGATVDAESDGQPSTSADGDGADDDGVIFSTTIVASPSVETASSFIVDASAAGKLDAWIDFNLNGNLDSGEHLGGGVSFDVTPGRHVIPFTLPAGAAVQTSAAARFRISSAGSLAPTGLALDGEVEDYVVPVVDGRATPDIDVAVLDEAAILRVDNGQFEVVDTNVDLFRAPLANVGRVRVLASDGDSDIVFDFGGGQLPPTGIEVDGGLGVNTLTLLGSGDVNFTGTGDTIARNISRVDLSDGGVNEITVDANAVAGIISEGRLKVLGGQDDSINFNDAANWRMGGTFFDNGRFVRSVTHLLQGDAFDTEFLHPWQNLIRAGDVNNDGNVSAGDALVIINELGRRAFSIRSTAALLDPSEVAIWPGIYYDQNGDDQATALDALRVINQLARQSGSGEAEQSPVIGPRSFDTQGSGSNRILSDAPHGVASSNDRARLIRESVSVADAVRAQQIDAVLTEPKSRDAAGESSLENALESVIEMLACHLDGDHAGESSP